MTYLPPTLQTVYNSVIEGQFNLKGQYCHDQSSILTGHGIVLLFLHEDEPSD